jgi:hypothetical protein
MAGLIDSFMQGYINRVNAQNGGGRAANNTLAAQNTASAFQRLQDAISQDYSQQQAQAKASGQEWKMPSPTERFNDQVQAMILSGDPQLQERGLALMTPDAMDKPTDFQRNFEYLKQSNPNLTEMEYFKTLHPGQNTRINVNLPKMDQPISLEDLQKLQLPNGQPVPIGSSMRDAGNMGAKIAQTNQQGSTGSAAQVSADAIKTLGQNLNPTSNIKDTVIESMRNAPGIVGQVSSVAAGAAGIPTNPAAVKFNQSQSQASSQLLKIMSGASATDEEYQRIKSLFPQMTDSPEAKAIKYNTMLEQTQAIVDRAKSQGVTNLPDLSTIPRVAVPGQRKPTNGTPQAPQAPQAPKAPVATKRFNPATGKIEEIR